MPHDLATGWRDNDDYDRMLLTHAANAEMAVLCFEKMKKENEKRESI